MKVLKQYLTLILGIVMLGCGMGMLVKVGIGSDSISCFYEGLASKINVSIGTISIIMNFIFLLVVFILDKSKIGISTFAFMILSKYPIDIGYELFITPNNLFIAIILDILICVIIGTGCSVIIKAGYGVTAYDSLTLSVSEKLKGKYVIVRYIFDGSFLLLGFLLGGTIGIGTIIALIVIGPVFDFTKKLLIKE